MSGEGWNLHLLLYSQMSTAVRAGLGQRQEPGTVQATLVESRVHLLPSRVCFNQMLGWEVETGCERGIPGNNMLGHISVSPNLFEPGMDPGLWNPWYKQMIVYYTEDVYKDPGNGQH